MKVIVLALLFLVIMGCRKEIDRKQIGATVIREETVSCTYSGMCFTCWPGGIGMDGKLSNQCGIKLSTMCSGSQPAQVKAIPMQIVYDDGSTHDYEHTEVIKIMGQCQ